MLYKTFILESGRTYIKDGKMYSGIFNSFGELIETKSDTIDNRWKHNLLNYKKEYLVGTCLEYVADIIDEIPKAYRVCFIRNYIKNPIIERIYRSKLKPIVIKALYRSYGDAISELQYLLSNQLISENFHTMVGLNNYQIDEIYELWRENFASYYDADSEIFEEKICDDKKYKDIYFADNYFCEIRVIKNILSMDNISYLDNESFDKLLFYVSVFGDGYTASSIF